MSLLRHFCNSYVAPATNRQGRSEMGVTPLFLISKQFAPIREMVSATKAAQLKRARRPVGANLVKMWRKSDEMRQLLGIDAGAEIASGHVKARNLRRKR